MGRLTCPQCGNDDQARIGCVVYPPIYDGAVVWLCMACRHEWDRFPDDRRIASALADMRGED